jgi:hypothetical protein
MLGVTVAVVAIMFIVHAAGVTLCDHSQWNVLPLYAHAKYAHEVVSSPLLYVHYTTLLCRVVASRSTDSTA